MSVTHHCNKCNLDCYPTKRMGQVWICSDPMCGAETSLPPKLIPGQAMQCKACHLVQVPAMFASSFIPRCPKCGNEYIESLKASPMPAPETRAGIASDLAKPSTPHISRSDPGSEFDKLDSVVAWMRARATILDTEIEAHERALAELTNERARIRNVLSVVDSSTVANSVQVN